MAAREIAPIGIAAALNWELAGFKAVCRPGNRSLLLEATGPGLVAADFGAHRLVERKAAILVSWGTAGGLQSGLVPGDLVLADRVGRETGGWIDCDRRLTARLESLVAAGRPVHRGAIVSVGQAVCKVYDKQRLARSSKALAVDMESAAIAAVARQHGLPFLALRVVVDGVGQAVPPLAIAAMEGSGIRPGRVLAGLIKSPRQLSPLLALAFAGRRARTVLAECAGMLPALADDDPMEGG